jgi:hypothetical protein
MVVIGRDADRAVRELETLAPSAGSVRLARERAERLDVRPIGTADAIVAALEAGPPG